MSTPEEPREQPTTDETVPPPGWMLIEGGDADGLYGEDCRGRHPLCTLAEAWAIYRAEAEPLIAAERSRHEAREADTRRAATEALDALDAYRVALAKAEDTEAELRGEVERLREAAGFALATDANMNPDCASALRAALAATVAPEPPSAAEEPRCEQTCDHGSRCTLPAGHEPSDRHETAHGCICYDPDEVDAVLAMSDEEITAEIRARGEDPREVAKRVRTVLLDAVDAYKAATPGAEPPPEETCVPSTYMSSQHHAMAMRRDTHDGAKAEAERQRDEAIAGRLPSEQWVPTKWHDAAMADLRRKHDDRCAANEAEVAALREALRHCQRLTLNVCTSGIAREVHETCIAALAAHPAPDPTSAPEEPTR